MAEITVEELLERQARMSAAMEEISKETDANRIVEMAAELQEEGRELEAMAREFEAQETAKASQNLGSIEVKLTDAQRKRILDETGVEMHTLVLADPSGSLNENMPNTSPELIEFWALEEARRRKAKGEAEEAAQEQIADAINDIREQGTPQLQELLDEKLADPSFLAGIRPK